LSHRIHKTILAAAACLSLLAVSAGAARADQVRYIGVHPISVEVEGEAFCYIEGPHIHAYKPKNVATLYRLHDGHYHFVGDPIGFGYDGPKHGYYGHHPVHLSASVGVYGRGHDHHEYCYLDGPHYHNYQPPPRATFVVDGGLYWYSGAYSPAYRKGKARHARINAVYAPMVYARPVVTIAPPAVYVGPVLAIHARGRGPGAVVVGPEVGVGVGVGVGISAGVEVGVAVPGVVIVEDRPRRYKKHKRGKSHHRGKRHRKRF
jgi:hypothetical protein